MTCTLAPALAGLLALAIPASASTPAEGRAFGAALTLERPTPLTRLLADPERYAGTPVLVRGRLTDLCRKKGCWTILEDGGSHVRVRFRDYGFFLPQEALGATALVEGVVEVRTLSEREARHLASESRDGNPEAIEGPQREVGFVAAGVRLLQPEPKDPELAPPGE